MSSQISSSKQIAPPMMGFEYLTQRSAILALIKSVRTELETGGEEGSSQRSLTVSIPKTLTNGHIAPLSQNSASINQATQLLTDFLKFNRLPGELKNIIWSYVLPRPRVIRPLRTKDDKTYYSPAQIPPLLHACSSSRQYAKRTYTLCITPFLRPGFGPRHGRIWFSYEHDFFAMAGDALTFMRQLPHIDDKDLIRNVLLEVTDDENGSVEPRISLVESNFKAVKELVLVGKSVKMSGDWAFREEFAEVHRGKRDWEWQQGRTWETIVEEAKAWRRNCKYTKHIYEILKKDPPEQPSWTIKKLWRGEWIGSGTS